METYFIKIDSMCVCVCGVWCVSVRELRGREMREKSRIFTLVVRYKKKNL